jgi:hypothetical protein
LCNATVTWATVLECTLKEIIPVPMESDHLMQMEGVESTLADRPEPGADWKAEQGWGWIFKAWFRSWPQSRETMKVIAAAGWEPKFWGRKLRVAV